MKFPKKIPSISVGFAASITAGMSVGLAGSSLYFHEMQAFCGFTIAAMGFFIVRGQAQFIAKLLLVNQIVNNSMSKLLRDLQEAGIEVQEVEVPDTDLARKGLH